MTPSRTLPLRLSLSALLALAPVSAQGVQGIPLGVPAAPVILSVASVTPQPTPDVSSDMVVSWQAALDGSGQIIDGASPITGYTATVMSGASFDIPTAASCTVPPNNAVPTFTFTCTVTGLGYGKTYKLQVVANNAVGSSLPALSASFTTPALSQSVTISGNPSSKEFGDPSFPLTASATSGLAVVWSTPTPAVCAVGITGVVGLLGVGNCTVTATQNGDGSHYASASASVSFTVTGALSATATGATGVQANSATLNARVPYPGAVATPSFCISITNSTGSCALPSGVTISAAMPSTVTSSSATSVSASVSGLASGTTYYYWVRVTADGLSATSSTASFQTLIAPALSPSGPLSPSGSTSGTVGIPLSVTISAASGSGVYSNWVASSLPTGLVFIPGSTSAIISGTPALAGDFTSQVSVTDDLGVTTTLTLNFTISPAVAAEKPRPTPSATPPPILEARVEGAVPVAIPLPNIYPTSLVVIANGDPKSIRGVFDATVVDGVLTIIPFPVFSGKISFPVTITTNGISTTLIILLTVAPAPATKAVQVLTSATASTVSWTLSRNAIGYQLLVNGKRSCATALARCVVPKPLGPKTKIEIIAFGGDGTTSIKVVAVYAPNKAIEVAAVNFAAQSSTIDSIAKKKLLAFVALVKTQGFTSVTITGHVNSKHPSKAISALASLRAKTTLKFLSKYLKVSMKIVAQGAQDSIANNKTKTGQAANRRVALLVK